MVKPPSTPDSVKELTSHPQDITEGSDQAKILPQTDILRLDIKQAAEKIPEVDQIILQALGQRANMVIGKTGKLVWLTRESLPSYAQKGTYIPAIDITSLKSIQQSDSKKQDPLISRARNIHQSVQTYKQQQDTPKGANKEERAAHTAESHKLACIYAFYDAYGQILAEDTQLDTNTKIRTQEELEQRKQIIEEKIGIPNIPALLEYEDAYTQERFEEHCRKYEKYRDQMAKGKTDKNRHVIDQMRELDKTIQKEQCVYTVTEMPMRIGCFDEATWEKQLAKHVSNVTTASGYARIIGHVARQFTDEADQKTAEEVKNILGIGGTTSTVNIFKAIAKKDQVGEQERKIAVQGLYNIAQNPEKTATLDAHREPAQLEAGKKSQIQAASELLSIAKNADQQYPASIQLQAIQLLGKLSDSILFSDPSQRPAGPKGTDKKFILSHLVELNQRKNKKDTYIHKAIDEAIIDRLCMNPREALLISTRYNGQSITDLKVPSSKKPILRENLRKIVADNNEEPGIRNKARETFYKVSHDIAQDETVDLQAQIAALKDFKYYGLADFTEPDLDSSSEASSDDGRYVQVNDKKTRKILSTLIDLSNDLDKDHDIYESAKESLHTLIFNIYNNKNNTKEIRMKALESLQSKPWSDDIEPRLNKIARSADYLSLQLTAIMMMEKHTANAPKVRWGSPEDATSSR